MGTTNCLALKNRQNLVFGKNNQVSLAIGQILRTAAEKTGWLSDPIRFGHGNDMNPTQKRGERVHPPPPELTISPAHSSPHLPKSTTMNLGSVTANIGWCVVSEIWHHFWELPKQICWV